MKKSICLIISLLFLAITNAIATPMYCAANVLNADPLTTKVHENIKSTLQRKCDSQDCKDKVASFVASLPSYPVNIDTTTLAYQEIPKVDQYHTSLCYEVNMGEIPACDTLFNKVNQPDLLESALRSDFKTSTVNINNLRHFFVEKTGEYWLVADLSPIQLSSGKSMNLHISLFITKDKALLDDVEKSLSHSIPEISLSLGDISCRMGIKTGIQK